MAEDVPLLHRGDVAVVQVEVGPTDRRARDLDDGVPGIEDLRVGDRVDADLAFPFPANRFHGATTSESEWCKSTESDGGDRRQTRPDACPSIVAISPVFHQLLEVAQVFFGHAVGVLADQLGDRHPQRTGGGLVVDLEGHLGPAPTGGGFEADRAGAWSRPSPGSDFQAIRWPGSSLMTSESHSKVLPKRTGRYPVRRVGAGPDYLVDVGHELRRVLDVAPVVVEFLSRAIDDHRMLDQAPVMNMLVGVAPMLVEVSIFSAW